MRRTLIALLLCAGVLALAGCGNKGPLVRPPAKPVGTKATPARPASTSKPVAPARTHSPATSPDRSPPLPKAASEPAH